MSDLNHHSQSARRSYSLTRRGMLAVSAGGLAAIAGCTNEADDPVTVRDWHDLAAIRDNLAGDYVLAADLDAQTDGYVEHVGGVDGGWQAIGGMDSERGFAGTFDGDGHVIADLQIDRPETYNAGLFGFCTGFGAISNLELRDVEITGDRQVGALAGITGDFEVTNVTAHNVTVHGTAAGADVTDTRVGGLIGRVSAPSDTVDRAAVVNGQVSGISQVGGIAGEVVAAEVTRAAVVETAIEASYRHAGGLIGRNAVGEISQAQTQHTTVTGERGVGGLTGAERQGTVSQAWTATSVTGEEQVGGFAGAVEPESSLTGCYWDSEYSDLQTGVGTGPDGTTALTTEAMQGMAASEHMPELDFEETWQPRVDPPDYPDLDAGPV